MGRILVVDDDEDIRNLVQARLRGAGHLVVAARSGPEALEAIDEKGPPDVAVLDVSMPGMTGFALLEELRGRQGMADLPVIFLSAKVQEEDVEEGRSLGAVYLTKPFVATALLDAVEKALPSSEGSW
ncbi:MAG TPA: response regulator [Actinomycetota bacterium]|nr:response regulator [Actinomycetota bacterium]